MSKVIEIGKTETTETEALYKVEIIMSQETLDDFIERTGGAIIYYPINQS